MLYILISSQSDGGQRSVAGGAPEEVADELLLLGGRVVKDHEAEPRGLVRVLGQPVLGEVVGGAVELLHPPLHLTQGAVGHLVFLGR